MLSPAQKALIELLAKQIIRNKIAASLAAAPAREQNPGVTPSRSPS
jgi:hypothetical protein